MATKEVRFTIVSEVRDGCATSFTDPVRVIADEWGYVTLFEWDWETGDWTPLEWYQSWQEFQATYPKFKDRVPADCNAKRFVV